MVLKRIITGQLSNNMQTTLMSEEEEEEYYAVLNSLSTQHHCNSFH